MEAGPSNRHGQTHSQQHWLRFFKGEATDVLWTKRHNVGYARDTSDSLKETKLMLGNMNEINWPQEHQYHTVLYFRGNTGTGFKARKNGTRGLQQEQSAESMCSVNSFTDVRALGLEGNHWYRRL